MTVPASAACTLCRMRISPVAGRTATRKPCTLKVTERPRPSLVPSASIGFPSAAEPATSPASASAARNVAIPATTVPVDPYAPVSCSTSSVSADTISMSSTPQPSAPAASCRCTVVVPLPNSAVPTASRYPPPSRCAIRTCARCPPGGTVSSIATAIPVPVRHPSPSGTGRPRAAGQRGRHQVEALGQPVAGDLRVGLVAGRTPAGRPGGPRCRRRNSSGSRPSDRASSSSADSTANADWDSPYPRNAPAGTVLVYTDQPSTRLAGQR